MNLLEKYYYSFKKHSEKQAFCINGTYYTYSEFFKYISGTRLLLESKLSDEKQNIGVLCYDCFETYAAIFAIWFSGNCFVPINPKHPRERNMSTIQKTGVKFIITPKKDVENIIEKNKKTVLTNNSLISDSDLNPETSFRDNMEMYILTTSGSTGVPKYVPVSLKNVEAYCSGFTKIFPELNSNTHFLQTYDLTSDASFTGLLLPLLHGGCVYTIPDRQFKFLSIASILTNKKINWVKMTPSVLNYLDPYIDKLNLSHIRYLIFGGEALSLSLIKKWQKVFPEAEFINLYGPTETTISASAYRFQNPEKAHSKNNIISIGKPFPNVEFAITDKNQQIKEPGKTGELCISGEQTMKNYLNSDIDPFIYLNNGNQKKYYRTGDLVEMDQEGYYYFSGRTDDQVKINGYRINLAEVEINVKSILPEAKIVVLTHEKTQGIKRLYLFIENPKNSEENIISVLKNKLPGYMVPESIFYIDSMPLKGNGKIDKLKLIKEFLE